MLKQISLLGSTGSIGTQTLDVIRQHKDKFQLVALSVGRNLDLARKQINEFSPRLVSVMTKDAQTQLESEVGGNTRVVYGAEGLLEVATAVQADVVVNAVLGSVGLAPTLAAIKEGKVVALANKEPLVTAGHIITEAARQAEVPILPVDSEHSAIFQALNGENKQEVERLILTGSGGSFRDLGREQLEKVTLKEALNHPNWSMGAKITIDSATMMNKGLEVIEAHWLFELPYEQIDVLLHRESIIHSMVEFIDTSVIAQLGTPDMRVPIQYALTYPNRLEMRNSKRLNLWEVGKLHFAQLDTNRYRCVAFAYEAGRLGGTMPTVLNAANEVAVAAFIDGKISFLAIESLIEQALERHQLTKSPTLDEILAVDRETRAFIVSKLE